MLLAPTSLAIPSHTHDSHIFPVPGHFLSFVRSRSQASIERNGMCNLKLYPASDLDLVLSRRSGDPASFCRPTGRPTFRPFRHRQKQKKRINRCIHHARNFCVWINRHVFAQITTTLRMSFQVVEKFAAGRVIRNPPRRYSSAGTAIALFARSPLGDIIETIARSVCIPVMLTCKSREIG